MPAGPSALPPDAVLMDVPYNWHDIGCRRVLKHPATMAALLEVLFGAGRAVDLDLGGLRAEPTRQTGPALRQAENDVIWSAPHGPDGQRAYFIIEVQSTVEPDMALRMMDYVALNAQDLRSTRHLQRPVIVPVVLYTGERRWRSSLDAGELFADLDPERQGRLLYHLADLFRLEVPEGTENLVLLLAAVVQGASEEGLVRAARGLYGRLVALGGRGLEQAYFELVRALAVDKWPDGKWENCKTMAELVDALEESVQTWPEKWKARYIAEGRSEGHAEGRAEGHAEGRAEGISEGHAGTSLVLLALLERVVRARFGGSVAEAFRQQVATARQADAAADREVLETIGQYVELSADSEDLLARIRSHHPDST